MSDKAKGLRVSSERRIGELGVRCLGTLNSGQGSRQKSHIGRRANLYGAIASACRRLQEDLAAALLGGDRWLVDVVVATPPDCNSEDGAILVVMEYLVVGLEVNALHGCAVQLHARKPRQGDPESDIGLTTHPAQDGGLTLRSDLIAIELLRPFAERGDTLCFEGRYVTLVIDDEEVTGLLDAVFVGVRVLGKQALCLTIADELEGPGLTIDGAGAEAEHLLDVLQLLVAEVEGAVVGLSRVAGAKDIKYFHSI